MSLKRTLELTGRLPGVSLLVSPLSGGEAITLDRFLTYRFASSITTPVDTFDFAFVAPDSKLPMNKTIQDGDIVQLSADGKTLATGIIDATEVEVDREFGEKGSVSGRDLMAQIEDQDAISLDDKPIYLNACTVTQAVSTLVKNTRIRGLRTQNVPSRSDLLFATEPGESKLAALQRFLEPLNCLAWMNPQGYMVIGRPRMMPPALGTLTLSKGKRQSNVISMKVHRSATTIPNVIVPIWSGQETVQGEVARNKPEQRLLNAARGPSRLFRAGHRLPKAIVVSDPDAGTAQGAAAVNQIKTVKAGGSNLLQAYAKREFARQNMKEITVQCVVPGHFNDAGNPYMPDQVYKIEFDRGDVDEMMYLYQVEYELSLERGQVTNLYFCRFGSIVADGRAL